jgi:hypothetical protein
MVNEFSIEVAFEDGKPEPVAMSRILKEIRDRVDTCRVPQCWKLIDPHDDGQIYLPHQFFRGQKGKAVQIKQALFRMTYNKSPPVGQQIRNICGNPRCRNPAHFITKTWKPTYEEVFKMVSRGWLTWDQAEGWYGIDGTKEVNDE